MYAGISNPNIIAPLEKMRILPEKDDAFEVLYNPESYTLSRSVQYRPPDGFSVEQPSVQFIIGGLDQLTCRLFFDTLSSGNEVGGSAGDKQSFFNNSAKPAIEKQIDVRNYTQRVTNLLLVHPDLHRPQKVELKWSSLQFSGYLVWCSQNFVKFNEQGMPVRAWLDCSFLEARSQLAAKLGTGKSLNSPDTTKFHTVSQGESLWSLSTEAYGQPDQWRLIADANGIENPRRLMSGETLRLPALKK